MTLNLCSSLLLQLILVIFWTLAMKNISTKIISDSGKNTSYSSNSNLASSFNSGLNTVGLNNGYQNGGGFGGGGGGLSSSKWGSNGSSWNGK